MKNILSVITSVFTLFVFTIVSTAQPAMLQGRDQSFSMEALFLFSPAEDLVPAKSIPTEAVSQKALKTLQKNYNQATNTRWYHFHNIYLTDFTVNGHPAIAALQKNGLLLYAIITGSEDELPAQARKLFKANYVDYQIDLVKEVNTDHKTAWIIVGKQNNETALVRIMDQELTELAKYNNRTGTLKNRKGKIIFPD